MASTVVVLQSKDSETLFWIPTPESNELRPTEQIDALSPDAMLLASLGSSTAQSLHAYAQTHGLNLQDVELRLQYEQRENGANYRENGKRAGKIEEEIVLYGSLSPGEHDRLLSVAHQCFIYRMLDGGVEVKSHLASE
jgi:uncharacterized OsmC-like protein